MSAWLKCLNIDNARNMALVQSNRTGKSFAVTIHRDIKYLIHRGDLLEVIKSQVSREWMAVDYMAMTSTTAGDEE